MRRTEYLKSPAGQLHEFQKRSLKTLWLTVPGEPKSKGAMKAAEKKYFRQEVSRQMSELNRRRHTGDIILEIDFYTKKNDPPAVQTLVKNYLDLLHKEMPEIDNLSNILYKDDGQVKILIANYHVDLSDSQEARVNISTHSLGNFIKDIELAYKILNNELPARRGVHISNSSDEESIRDELVGTVQQTRREYEKHVKEELSFKKTLGEKLYNTQLEYLKRVLQERFLKLNQIKTRDLVNIFQRNFSSNKAHQSSFDAIWDIMRGYVFYTSSFVAAGGAPMKEGQGEVFKSNLKSALEKFRNQYPFLFPLLQPVSITIVFVPPKVRPLDSDNLARYILPILTEVLQPPQTFISLVHDAPIRRSTQRFSAVGLTGYQVVQIPRRPSDPSDGRIEFSLSEGILFSSNVWETVRSIIYEWKKTVGRY
jgi:hypothetical protein